MEPSAIGESLRIIINHILKGPSSYHRDYNRVTYLADLYKKLITGNGVESLLVRYNPRETKVQFEQRVRITQLITPAVCGKIKTPFYKVARIDNVKKNIIFENRDKDKNDELKSQIERSKMKYFGDETMDQFMESVYIDQSFSDPNAFLVVDFEGETELNGPKVQPFPIIVPSKDAISFSYTNNELDYLVVKNDFRLMTEKGEIDAIELRIYTGNHIIKFTEIESNDNASETDSIVPVALIENKTIDVVIKKRGFRVELIDQNSNGQIQAMRIGYSRDEVTDMRTFVSPMHPALPRMIKSIKATSEMDLTMTLHVFPQKTQYGKKCPGEDNDKCDNGYARNGKCKRCKGSGFDAITSSQDMLVLPMPRNNNDMIDVDKLVSYKSPPVDLVKFMSEFQQLLEVQAIQDVFTSESFNRIVAPKTLGEKELDMESVYDTLYPFANKYSSVYIKQVEMISVFTDNGNGIQVIHEFPKDFKLKTAKALIADRSSAKIAELPADLLNEIDNDIAVKLYANNPTRLHEYYVKQQHMPFKGKTDSQIQIAINMGLTTQFHKILWSNFDAIFEELEADFISNQMSFYDLPYDKRVEEVKKKTDEFIEMIQSQQPTSTLFPTTDPEEVE